MLMKKLVISGDSLSMPRPKEGILYEDTFPALLQEHMVPEWRVINRSRRANNSRKQAMYLKLCDDIHDYKPDVFIYHIGIVDCAPRLFSEFQQKLLERLPISVRQKIIGYFSRRRLYMTKRFPRVFVKPEDFKKYSQKVILTAKKYASAIYIIGIIMPSDKILKRSFGYRENVLGYNELLKEVSNETGAEFIDLVNMLDPKEDFLEDGYHLVKSGNRKIYEVLFERICNTKLKPD